LHVSTYTLPYLPVLIWVGEDRGAVRAVVVALLVAVPHIVVDDGRLVRGWLRQVEHSPDPAPSLRLMVDQTFHVVCLLGVAVLAALESALFTPLSTPSSPGAHLGRARAG
jgi:hypothetical protein